MTAMKNPLASSAGSAWDSEVDGYRCSQCSRVYKSSVTYRRHLKYHSGETQCRLCEKIFMSVPMLKDHMEFHMGRTKCHKCGKVFSTCKNLQNHFKTCSL